MVNPVSDGYVNLSELRVFGLSSLSKTAKVYSVSDNSNPSFSEPNILTPIAPRSHVFGQLAITDSMQS